jgi:NADPH-dependent 2,4-dienoyl-CoA reductase/sulfur reductase-like enzyme
MPWFKRFDQDVSLLWKKIKDNRATVEDAMYINDSKHTIGSQTSLSKLAKEVESYIRAIFTKKIASTIGIKTKEFSMKTYDVVVVGASIGGVIAAYSAAKEGHRVALVEKTNWIGGQLTSQAVPPDEHPFIESFGCTKTYRAFP